MSNRPDRIATWYAQLLLGVLPLVIVPGIDEYALLPRLAILQALSFFFSLFVVVKTVRGTEAFGNGFLHLSLFWIILAASVFWAVNPFRSTFDLAKHSAIFATFYLLSNTLERSSIPRILCAHAVAGILVSVIGIAEYFDISPFQIPSTGRPSSTFGFRNLAGAYLAAGIPIAFLLRLIGTNRLERALGTAATALMLIFLIYTRARASWFGLLAGSAGALLLCWMAARKRESGPPAISGRRIPLWRTLAPFALAAILALMPDRLAERHTQRFDEKKADFATTISSTFRKGGDRGRFAMWQATLNQIADHPLLGVGLGNWEYVYPLYDDGTQVSPGHSPHRPHNDLLWIWSETGTIGLILYLAMLWAIVRRCWRSWRNPQVEQDGTVAGCAVASMIAVLGVGMFSFPWERVPPEFLFWFSASLVWVSSPRDGKAVPSSNLALLLLPPLLLAGLWITVRHIRFDERYIQAHIAFQMKKYVAAGDFAEEALANGPFEHQAFIIQGEGLYREQKWDRAEESYLKIFDYHPNFANAYNGLGLVEQGRGNLEKALARYDQARAIIPNHYIATYNKAMVFEQMGMIDSAIAVYRESFHNDHTKPLINLGAIYRKMGMVDSAIALYLRAARDPIPSAEAWFNLGNVYAERKDFIASAEAYAQFLNRWPTDDSVRVAGIQGLSQAYSGFGVQAEMRGAVDSARASYRKAIEIDPNEPINWFNLGNVLREDKPEEAREAYERAIALDPTHLDSYNNLGMTYRDLDRTADAIEVFERALTLAPESPIVNYNLGHALMEIGEVERAQSALEVFRKTWTDDPILIHYYMGNVYAESGQIEQARTEYETFLQKWTGDPEIRNSVEKILRSILGGGSQ